jgi:hypothetical protein
MLPMLIRVACVIYEANSTETEISFVVSLDVSSSVRPAFWQSRLEVCVPILDRKDFKAHPLSLGLIGI